MSEYSTFWQKPHYQEYSEAPMTMITSALKKTADLGAQALEVRGGEPLIREDLPEILKSVRKDFHITLRTNGMLEDLFAKPVRGLIDHVLLLLYHPEPSIHDRIMGIEGFRNFRRTATVLVKERYSAEILFMVTRETITHLPEAVELATELGLPLRIEPHYLPADLAGFQKESVESMAYVVKKKNVHFSPEIEKILRTDTRAIHREFCKAGQRVITIAPDGSVLSPCVYAEGKAGLAGKLPACPQCSDWSYLIPFPKRSPIFSREEVNVS